MWIYALRVHQHQHWTSQMLFYYFFWIYQYCSSLQMQRAIVTKNAKNLPSFFILSFSPSNMITPAQAHWQRERQDRFFFFYLCPPVRTIGEWGYVGLTAMSSIYISELVLYQKRMKEFVQQWLPRTNSSNMLLVLMHNDFVPSLLLENLANPILPSTLIEVPKNVKKQALASTPPTRLQNMLLSINLSRPPSQKSFGNVNETPRSHHC